MVVKTHCSYLYSSCSNSTFENLDSTFCWVESNFLTPIKSTPTGLDMIAVLKRLMRIGNTETMNKHLLLFYNHLRLHHMHCELQHITLKSSIQFANLHSLDLNGNRLLPMSYASFLHCCQFKYLLQLENCIIIVDSYINNGLDWF